MLFVISLLYKQVELLFYSNISSFFFGYNAVVSSCLVLTCNSIPIAYCIQSTGASCGTESSSQINTALYLPSPPLFLLSVSVVYGEAYSMPNKAVIYLKVLQGCNSVRGTVSGSQSALFVIVLVYIFHFASFDRIQLGTVSSSVMFIRFCILYSYDTVTCLRTAPVIHSKVHQTASSFFQIGCLWLRMIFGYMLIWAFMETCWLTGMLDLQLVIRATLQSKLTHFSFFHFFYVLDG